MCTLVDCLDETPTLILYEYVSLSFVQDCKNDTDFIESLLEIMLDHKFNKDDIESMNHYTKYIFSVVTTLPCSIVIFNSLIIIVRYKCVAIFPIATSLIISFFSCLY